MGREEGGGFRMGNTCIPVTDSFWYMAKPIQYCKVKLNKILKKWKKKEIWNLANNDLHDFEYGDFQLLRLNISIKPLL